MATSQEIQVALDLIKHPNVPNDLLLSAAVPVAKSELTVTEGTMEDQTTRPMTVPEQKEQLARIALNIKGYKQKGATFLAVSVQRTMATAGLAQSRGDILEPPMVTAGEDFSTVDRLLANSSTSDYSAQDVLDYLKSPVARDDGDASAPASPPTA